MEFTEMRQLTAKDLGQAIASSGVSLDTPSTMVLLARHLAAIALDVHDNSFSEMSLEDFQPFYQEVLRQAAEEGYADDTGDGWAFQLAIPVESKFPGQEPKTEFVVRYPKLNDLRDVPGIKDPYKQGVARLRKLSGWKPPDIDSIAIGDYNLIISTLSGYVESVFGRHPA